MSAQRQSKSSPKLAETSARTSQEIASIDQEAHELLRRSLKGKNSIPWTVKQVLEGNDTPGQRKRMKKIERAVPARVVNNLHDD